MILSFTQQKGDGDTKTTRVLQTSKQKLFAFIGVQHIEKLPKKFDR
jgi:hypothetical protein